MPALIENDQRNFIGGGNGSQNNPYTVQEYDFMVSNGTWSGGYVEGWGYTFGDVVISGNNPYPGAGGVSGNDYPGDSGYWLGDSGNYWIDSEDNWWGSSGNNLGSGNFTFNTTGYAAFDNQLQSILGSNSIINNLLKFLNRADVKLTFGVEDYSKEYEGVTAAKTNTSDKGHFYINFNSNLINDNGWNNTSSGINNVGVDYSQARNMDEKLILTLAHEAMHANHRARYHAALREFEGRPNLAADWLINSGYSKEYVDIYFQENSDGKWEYNYDGNTNQRKHDYIRKHNQGVFKAALDEYREDFGY